MKTKILSRYSDLPIISFENDHLSKIVYYDQLVISIKGFSHPGTRQLLQKYINLDISNIFSQLNHSYNAELLIANLSIGRRGIEQGKGYKLFEKLKSEQLTTLHDRVMEKIDLKFGLLDQLSKLSDEQKNAFISIPKYFDNTQQIMFTSSKFQQFFYLDRFWISTTVFSCVFLFILGYLKINNNLFQSFYQITLFACGLGLWTIIQYFYHRFYLHWDNSRGKHPNVHQIHHAFPNHRNKIAQSIIRNSLCQLFAFFVLVKIQLLSKFDSLHLIMGAHLFMTLYDILHYYFHFGPEIKIAYLQNLKKSHMKHHFRDASRGFGVTTTFWDHTFGTNH